MRYTIVVLFLSFILAGCLKNSEDSSSVQMDIRNVNEDVLNGDVPNIDNSQPGQVKQTEYDLAEIAKHNNKDDCWLLIENKIYDVTSFIASGNHGGGEAILEGCGINATEFYKTRPMGSGTDHSAKAYGFLENYYIGDLGK